MGASREERLEARPEPRTIVLAALRPKTKIITPRTRAEKGHKSPIFEGRWPSGPSPGNPGGGGAKNKLEHRLKHCYVVGDSADAMEACQDPDRIDNRS